jgi:2-octaprenyl-6-methoxyphenol hydroxylase
MFAALRERPAPPTSERSNEEIAMGANADEAMRSAGTGTLRCDVAIVGSGVAGLTLALALKSALGGRLAVALCDPVLAGPLRDDGRAFAIAAGPRRMFETLGIWGAIGSTTQPILDMVITDSRVSDPVRPVFLTFGGEVEPGEPFAHMVEHTRLLAALADAARAAGVLIVPASARRCDRDVDGALLTLDGHVPLSAALVVACDGARSRLRDAAGIDTVSWSYQQSGIVATIAHERDHEGRAEEHFLPSGPFAILPLAGRRSSIVWSERTANVPALLALDDDDLMIEIERRFGLKLGALTMETRPKAYPLTFAVARSFVARRLALVGDAAHVIHPIAGQGLNMGLRDVAALAEAVVEAAALGLDVGSTNVLTRYERERRFDTVLMGVVTDGLNRLFSNDWTPARMARDLGLGLVDRMPGLKRLFIREAAALSPAAPRLFSGQPL